MSRSRRNRSGKSRQRDQRQWQRPQRQQSQPAQRQPHHRNDQTNGFDPDTVVFDPDNEANRLTFASSFTRKERAVAAEYAEWLIEWNATLSELNDMDVSPEVWSARLTLVDLHHDVGNMIRVLGWIRKGAHTMRREDKEQWCARVIERLDHRYDGIELVSRETGEVEQIAPMGPPSS